MGSVEHLKWLWNVFLIDYIPQHTHLVVLLYKLPTIVLFLLPFPPTHDLVFRKSKYNNLVLQGTHVTGLSTQLMYIYIVKLKMVYTC